MGRALTYLANEWDKLVVYLTDGRISIDNNATENAIRPFCLGRKNWLFHDTVAGAKASANLYGLIETCKASGLEPYHYLRRIFTDLPQGLHRRRPRGAAAHESGLRPDVAPLYAAALTSSPRPGAPTPGRRGQTVPYPDCERTVATPVGPPTRSTSP